uniref:Uncharacterized protein n=1 Tax=Solanum lycopersicum TaxID=4081 RepID=A0A3Q7HAH0_SOLLC
MDSDIKKELDWQEIISRQTDMLCGRKSTSPRGADLMKDQRRLEFYLPSPIRHTIPITASNPSNMCFALPKSTQRPCTRSSSSRSKRGRYMLLMWASCLQTPMKIEDRMKGWILIKRQLFCALFRKVYSLERLVKT